VGRKSNDAVRPDDVPVPGLAFLLHREHVILLQEVEVVLVCIARSILLTGLIDRANVHPVVLNRGQWMPTDVA
jgi:hypothetical protein